MACIPFADVSRPMRRNKKMIFPLGTSNRSMEEFAELLLFFRIQLVVDVRRFPKSRFEHFKKENLEILCRERKISYRWVGDLLGGFRSGGYEEYMKTGFFQEGMAMLEEWARSMVTVICCAERLPWRCHRRFITSRLEENNWEVVHIIDQDRVWVPGIK